MSRPVLVLNAGSSSLKYRLVYVHSGDVAASGLVEGIGEPDSPVADHEAALRAVLDAFSGGGLDLAEVGLRAVGHRVVHGGDRFSAPVLVDDAVEKAIDELSPLAPLHNPANLRGITVARRVLSDVPQVAVFDTAFHASLPPHAYTYAVPRDWERDHGVRRYGFHGTSHAYVSREAARLLGREPGEVNVVVLHLGNGASAAAVRGGQSVDTSMGLTPLQGLVMGTRSGDLDPAVPAHLARTAGLSLEDVDTALNRRSGLVGLAGDNDMRRIEQRAADGDEAARLALEVYCYRVRCYVGAYHAALGRLDAVAFTAGVGENSATVRSMALDGLAPMGIEVDDERNGSGERGGRVVSSDASRVAVLVVPTDEELEIARQAIGVVEG